MGETLLSALALMLLFEGLLPLANPSLWRKRFEQALQLSDGQLRFFGLTSMAAGLLLMMLIAG